MKTKAPFLAILLLVSFLAASHAQTSDDDDDNADHEQPVVDPQVLVSPSLRDAKVGQGSEFDENHLAIQVYSNPNIYLKAEGANGGEYNLDASDTLCTGKTYELADAALAGEWEPKGGPEDSPPIEFVPSLEEAKRQIESGTFNVPTYPAAICSWPARDTKEGPERCHFDAAVVCERKCNLNSEGVIREGSSFTASQQGDINIEYSCNADCMLFLKRGDKYINPYYQKFGGYGSPYLPPAYGYVGLRPDRLSTKAAFELETAPQQGPNIRIQSVHLPDEVSYKAVARVVLKNVGEGCAFLEDMNFDMAGEMLYSPKGKICAGETAEILFAVDSGRITNLRDMNLNIKYEAESLGCDKTKDREASFNLGRIKPSSTSGQNFCLSDSDCSTGEECCVNLCRPAAEGVCDDIDSDGILDTWVPFGK